MIPWVGRLAAVGFLALLVVGCTRMAPAPATPVEAGLNPAELIDPTLDSGGPPPSGGLFQLAEQIRQSRRPEVLPPRRSVLVLSGGGAYGAYPAGVLVGWTEAGGRPCFDVVTGVSTGALVAALAFLGPEFDPELRRVYTTLTARDIFHFKRSVRALLSEGLADNTPLGWQVRAFVTPENLARVAAEHRKGRRLYVATTDLDGRRQVIWDLGAIACQGTLEAQDLFGRVLLASAAIPGFFPPVRIPVEVDGVRYEERHVDGGVTAALFFRPPYVSPEQRADPVATSLYDSDLYIIVAGKLYPDPEPVSPRALTIAAASVSTLIYSQTRDELLKLYLASALTGMNYRLAAIPQEFPASAASTDFDPVKMSALFEEGVRQARCGTVWRSTPPGLQPGERLSLRGGTVLTRPPGAVAHGPIAPARPPARGRAPQPVAR